MPRENNTPEKFRELNSDLGVATELIIGNVVVGNLDYPAAYRVADAIRKRLKQEGSEK